MCRREAGRSSSRRSGTARCDPWYPTRRGIENLPPAHRSAHLGKPFRGAAVSALECWMRWCAWRQRQITSCCTSRASSDVGLRGVSDRGPQAPYREEDYQSATRGPRVRNWRSITHGGPPAEIDRTKGAPLIVPTGKPRIQKNRTVPRAKHDRKTNVPIVGDCPHPLFAWR